MDEYSTHNLLKAEEILYKTSKKFLWNCGKCGEEWRAQVNHRTLRGINCPKCSKRGSKGEWELRNFITNYGLEFLANDRKVIKPLELDIYIPELKIAIEYNGDYWHADEYLLQIRGVNAVDYHKNKFDKCSDGGVNLLFIWEHDWKRHGGIVLNSLYLYLNYGGVGIPEIFKRLTNDHDCYLCC